jgi:RNA polymerase sigma factor (sigma-70 family)
MLNQTEMPRNRTTELEQVYSAYVRNTDFWKTQFRISGEDFQDCLQEAWIKANRSLNNYDPVKAAFRSWFHSILGHQIADCQRKQSTERKSQQVAGKSDLRHSESTSGEAAPSWASGEYHLMREECQEAVDELLRETEDLLREYAPAHKSVFDGLISDIALREIALKLGRSEESVGASVRRKRQEFVAALNSNTALGERVRRIKALAGEIADLRHMLDESLTCPRTSKSTETFSGDDE